MKINHILSYISIGYLFAFILFVLYENIVGSAFAPTGIVVGAALVGGYCLLACVLLVQIILLFFEKYRNQDRIINVATLATVMVLTFVVLMMQFKYELY